MKYFIKRVSLFVIILAGVLSLSLVIQLLIISKSKSIFKIKESRTILVLGDSHTECALNDSIIKSVVNISSSADAYIYSYLKLKKFVEVNPQINTIILGFGYHDLGLSLERWTYDDKFMVEKFPKYFCLMDGDDFFEIVKSKPQSLPKLIPEIYRNTLKLAIKSILKQDFKQAGFGNFIDLHYNKLKDDIERIKKQKNEDEINFHYSPNQVKYLLLISEYCALHNLKLILLATPIYKNLRISSELMKGYYYQFYNKYLSENILLDFSNENLAESYFADSEHLNSFGAKYFSKFINYKLTALIKNEKELSNASPSLPIKKYFNATQSPYFLSHKIKITF